MGKASMRKSVDVGAGLGVGSGAGAAAGLGATPGAGAREDVLLEACGIMKEYDGETVLAGCNLQVRPGEVVALVGPSGAGKSTLLSIMGLLLAPSAGKVLVGGVSTEDMKDAEVSALRARSFGFVFQHTQLIGSLRAIDNMLVSACFGRSDMEAAASRVAALVKRFGLENRVNHFPHQLSVGQKRRVALVRALSLDPAVLMADEPTNDLDGAARAEVADALEEFAASREGRAVVCVTHDVALARRATRVVRLEDGRLVEISPQDIKEVGRAC